MVSRVRAGPSDLGTLSNESSSKDIQKSVSLEFRTWVTRVRGGPTVGPATWRLQLVLSPVRTSLCAILKLFRHTRVSGGFHRETRLVLATISLSRRVPERDATSGKFL